MIRLAVVLFYPIVLKLLIFELLVLLLFTIIVVMHAAGVLMLIFLGIFLLDLRHVIVTILVSVALFLGVQ